MSTTWGSRHLLVKFSWSRNPISRRTNQSTAHITAEEAIATLTEYKKQIEEAGTTEEGDTCIGARQFARPPHELLSYVSVSAWQCSLSWHRK